jgi:hypothetical protein
VKVGDYTTIQAIKNQSEARWVVLSDWKYKQLDGYQGIDGGIIRCIADTKKGTEKVDLGLIAEGIETLLVCGAIEPLTLGGVVFVE